MDVTDREQLAKDLAQTYEGGRVDHPWERVQEHQEVLEYTARNPNKGSSAVAGALELPRGRVRPWMDNGAKPDASRAIDTAEANGWLDLALDGEQFQAFNVLVAWIFASGSITEQDHVPYFVVDDESDGCVEHCLRTIGITDFTVNRSDEDGRANEMQIGSHGTTLGRFLMVLGAPVGPKNDDADISLPSYLDDAPDRVRTDFVRAYLWNRGTLRTDRNTDFIQIREERDAAYRNQFHQLLNSLHLGCVHGESKTFHLSSAASEEFYRPPSICE